MAVVSSILSTDTIHIYVVYQSVYCL